MTSVEALEIAIGALDRQCRGLVPGGEMRRRYEDAIGTLQALKEHLEGQLGEDR